MNQTKIKGRILASGEVTGHAHRADVDVYLNADGTREFDGPAIVSHEEHGPITLPAKEFASAQVREFDYLQQMSRPVQD